jgi:AraC family transcriptional regulator of adaptative response / DNA-3-methyladenine glycosylase II
MTIDDDACYRALTARDARFDGVFFVAVRTTGIYCRPVCTAKTPRRSSCRFFASAALAEQAGFRPCLRCRPELAPGHAPVDSARTVARAAAARIEAGALNEGGSLEQLAATLRLSSRQLRRAVRTELGVSPIELAQTSRLLLAKRLIAETQLPMVQVAFAAGFDSVRRFNALFRSHYRLTPSELRRTASTPADANCVRLTLAYRPPLDWAALLRFLAARAIPGVECVADGAYQRTVAVGEHRGWLSVADLTGRNELAVELATELVPALPLILTRLRNLFDLDARPDVIASHLARDPLLGRSVKRCPGLRVPGAFDSFELSLRAMLGQQVSVRAASTLAGRFAARFGEPIATPRPCLNQLTPTAASLAAARTATLAGLGVPTARAEGLRGLAHAVATGVLDLDPSADPTATIAQLTTMLGIGPWTAAYIAMRALRWPDAFPAGDLGLLKASGEKSARSLTAAADRWRPWRAYAAMHLWESLRPAAKRTPKLSKDEPMTATTCYTYIDSPLGQLLVCGDGRALTGLYTPGHRRQPDTAWAEDDEPFEALREQLAAYFDGARQDFDVPLELGGTPFQQRVWRQLQRIPFGETISYAELARRIGQPTASRAVGHANGRNPVSIIVPCHRVIGVDGKLTGYGGGLECKEHLLEMERHTADAIGLACSR